MVSWLVWTGSGGKEFLCSDVGSRCCGGGFCGNGDGFVVVD